MANTVSNLIRRATSEGGLCLLLLAASAVIILLPLIGEDAFPYRAAGPPGGAALTRLEPDDMRFFSSQRVLNEAVRGGDSLLWNPGEFAGVPFLAQWSTRCVSPFSLPFYVLDLQKAHAVSAFLKLLIAAWLAYYVARVLGLARGFALMVGLSQQLTGYLLLWLHHPVSDVLPWVPLLFLYTERLALGQTRYWPTGALVLALMLMGGDPIAVAMAVGFFACYFALRLRAQGSERVIARPLSSAVASITIALLVSATQILPFIEWWRESLPLAPTPGFVPNVLHLVCVVFPSWVLGPTTSLDQRSAALLFIGPVQFLLFGLWWAVRRYVPAGQRSRIDALLGLGGGCIVAAIAVAPSASYIPMLTEVFHLKRLLIACPFAIGLGCAAAGDAWIRLKPAQFIPALRLFTLYSVIGAVTVSAAVLLAVAGGQHTAPDALAQTGRLGICAVGVLLLLGLTLVRPRARIVAYGLGLLIVAQAYVAFEPAIDFATEEDLFENAEALEMLESADGRIGMGPSATAWQLAAVGVPTFYGTGDRVLRRYDAFSQRLVENPALMYRTAPAALLLSKEDLQGVFRPIRPMLRVSAVFDSNAVLFECLRCGEMVRFGDADSDSPSVGYAVDRDAAPSEPLGAVADENEWSPIGRTLRIAQSNDRVAVRLGPNDAGALVLAMAYYPGWRVSLDGNPAKVYVVDDLFMGVDVPEGTKEVVFEYESRALFWGRILSILGGIIVLFGVANVFYYRLHDKHARV